MCMRSPQGAPLHSPSTGCAQRQLPSCSLLHKPCTNFPQPSGLPVDAMCHRPPSAAPGDRPYLISGADDHLAKVWDYQTKACVQTLEGHAHNVSSACFHPELPIIVTGSEDGTVRLWHSTTYRLENTLNYGLERLWAIGYCRGSNR